MSGAVIHVVDDDASVRNALAFLLKSANYTVNVYASGREFLAAKPATENACLLTDVRMPDMDGMELQTRVARDLVGMPVIVMTGHGDIPLAVRAMRAGAVDFLEKPFADLELIDGIRRALEIGARAASRQGQQKIALQALDRLTPREREVLDLLVAGHSNKVIAHRLTISIRTVELHRVRVMEKMEARTVADLVRKAIAAGLT